MLSSSTPWSPPSFCPSVSGEPPQRDRQTFFLLSSLLVVFEVGFLHLALSQQTRLLRKPSQPKKKQTEKWLFSASYRLTCLSFFLCWFVSLRFPRAESQLWRDGSFSMHKQPPARAENKREREGGRESDPRLSRRISRHSKKMGRDRRRGVWMFGRAAGLPREVQAVGSRRLCFLPSLQVLCVGVEIGISFQSFLFRSSSFYKLIKEGKGEGRQTFLSSASPSTFSSS